MTRLPDHTALTGDSEPLDDWQSGPFFAPREDRMPTMVEPGFMTGFCIAMAICVPLWIVAIIVLVMR